MFPNGVSAYVDLMQNLIPGMKDGTVRTAIDTGCGVSLSEIFFFYLLLGILTCFGAQNLEFFLSSGC